MIKNRGCQPNGKLRSLPVSTAESGRVRAPWERLPRPGGGSACNCRWGWTFAGCSAGFGQSRRL